MRIHTKLIIQTCILILIATTLFFIYVRLEFQKTTVLFQGQKKDVESIFDRIVELKSKTLEALVVDYTYWDDFVNYVKTPTKAWAEQNLKTVLPTFVVDLLVVYNPKFTPVSYFVSEGNEFLYDELNREVALDKVFEQNRVRHFFIHSPKGVLEVYAATIHPTNDPQRTTQPQGSMFAVRLWSKEYLDEISKITDCQLVVIYPFSKATLINKMQYKEEEIQFSRILRGWDDNPVVRIDITRVSPSVIEFKAMSRQELAIIIFFVLFIALVYIRFILSQVHDPLVLISKALKENNLQYISKMRTRKNEFGEIARLIFKFSENEVQLAKEVDLLKIAEDKLEKERDRVQEYLDIAGVMFVILDINGNISMINKKGCAILGYEEQDIMGKNWFLTCLPKESKAEVFSIFDEIISGSKDFKEYYENQVVRKDGLLRTIAFHNAVLKNKESRIIGILFSGEDITERKQAEKDLHKISSELRVIVDSSQSMIFYKDRDNHFLLVNKAFTEIVGLPREAIEGKTAFDIFPENANRYWEDDLEVMRAKQKKLNIIEPLVTPEGLVWLRTDKIPYVDEQGNVIGVIGFSLDITRQKQIEDSLRESEEKFRSIVDNIGIGVAMISPDMEILSLNNQMKEWNPQIDLKQKSICYRAFNNPPREESCSYCPTIKTLKDGEVHEAITETPMNGQILNYRIISSPIKDSSGKVVAAIEMVEDITERKKMEEELRDNEERFRVLFDGSHDALMTLEAPDFKFASGNLAAIKLFGFKEEKELINFYPWDISPEVQPDGRKSIEKGKELLEVALNEGSCYFEWVHRHSDGREFPCVILLSVLTFGGKKIIQASVRDITERKKIEDELTRKTEFLEAQKEASLDGLLVVDEKKQRVLINNRLIELWQVPQYVLEDKNDQTLLEFVINKTKDPQQFLDKVNYLYSHKEEKSRDEVEFKDGMIFDRYSSPVIDKNGKYFGRIWTFRDITELKQAEQELKKDLHDLEVFYKASIGREERILELKKQIKDLERRLGGIK